MPRSVTTAPKPQPLDDETAAALTLYNTYLIADREQRAHERALKKAAKAKDEAAAAVRKLNDRKAPAAEMAEAETKYREAAEALQHLRDGEAAEEAAPEDDDSDEDDTAATTDSDEDAAEDSASDEETPTEEDAAEEAQDSAREAVDETPSVGVEASVGDEDLAGDEPAGVAG